MNIPPSTEPKPAHLNEDPLTHEPGAHPIATGVGAAGGAATGAALGMAVGGPVGGLVGAVLGVFAGGFSGSVVGEAVDPTDLELAAPGAQAGAAEASARAEGKLSPETRGAERSELTTPESTAATVLLEREHSSRDENGLGGLPTHDEVALRAWRYYEEEGFADGHDLEHWLRAEAEMRRTA